MSVPRCQVSTGRCESEMQQRLDVPAGTASNQAASQSEQVSNPRQFALSTRLRSAPRNPSCERCVSCVPSAVALRKRAPSKRIDELRIVASAYPQASPKDTLKRVFDRMKRAAQTEKSRRLSERLAPQFAYPESAYHVRVRRETERFASSAAVSSAFASGRNRYDA